MGKYFELSLFNSYHNGNYVHGCVDGCSTSVPYELIPESDNMGEKLSVSAPYVGLPLLPSCLHDVHQQQQSIQMSSVCNQTDIFKFSGKVQTTLKSKMQLVGHNAA